MRYYKSIGLGFKTPKEAIEGSYVDKKCPFTGNVSIRGRILKVTIKSLIIHVYIYNTMMIISVSLTIMTKAHIQLVYMLHLVILILYACTLICTYLILILLYIIFIYQAMVISTKMKRTIVIRRDYLQYVSKYRRFEKRHKVTLHLYVYILYDDVMIILLFHNKHR